MCVVYWSEIHNLSTKGGSFSITLNAENMRFWLTFFIGFVIAHFLSIWHKEVIIQQLKAWSFQMWKNLVHTQSNSDTIARWSSITFFFIHPVQQLYHSLSSYMVIADSVLRTARENYISRTCHLRYIENSKLSNASIYRKNAISSIYRKNAISSIYRKNAISSIY